MDFEEFKRLVVGLFARYPGAVMSEATIPVYWADLHTYPREAIIDAFRRAPRGNPKFCPSSEEVRSWAEAWRAPTPRADFSRSALPEPPAELDPGNPLHDELASINAKMKSGELKGLDVMRAVVKAVCDT